MLNLFKLPVLVLTIAAILSCNHNPKAKDSKASEKTADSAAMAKDTVIPLPAIDVANDNLASFIAGMPGFKDGCYSRIDSVANWKSYSENIDSLFNYGNALRMEKMGKWADSELVRDPSITTLFYPFGGPDFLNANIYYRDVSQYILIGLEPIGTLPDLCKMTPVVLKNYLGSVTNTLRDLMRRSYFITMHMNEDLSKAKINGTLPMMSIFLKRRGYDIVSIQKVGVDTLGNCVPADSLKYLKKFVSGVRIDFAAPNSTKVQSVYYFRTDISDKGLEKTPGFKAYLSKIPKSYTFLKAASFLMHFDDFKMIRNQIFSVSTSILQDDSGIAYKYFDKEKWNIKLYGKYSKPGKEFAYILESDLEAAFKNSTVGKLPYSLGYNWRSDHTSLLYAIKK
jgi:hypothetical protein